MNTVRHLLTLPFRVLFSLYDIFGHVEEGFPPRVGQRVPKIEPAQKFIDIVWVDVMTQPRRDLVPLITIEWAV